MKITLLTLARVTQILREHDIDLATLDLSNNVTAITLAATLSDDATLTKLCAAIEANAATPESIMTFFMSVAAEFNAYNAEIQRRIDHATTLGIYKPDPPEVVAARAEENKNLYAANTYLSNYSFLSRRSVDPDRLAISECMIILEDIICEELNKATMELLSLIGSDDRTFCDQVKEVMKHANFYAISLDIYNDVEKMYEKVERKREEKFKK